MPVTQAELTRYIADLDDDDLPMTEGMRPDPAKMAAVLATSATPQEVMRRQGEYLVPVRARG